MGALEYCKKYKQKLVVDKDLEGRELHPLLEDRTKVIFSVHYADMWLGSSSHATWFSCLSLDVEDLEYLYNKYKHTAAKEMEAALLKFKQDHGDI